MDPKKLDSQAAFEQVSRKLGLKRKKSEEPMDVEAHFGDESDLSIKDRPVWLRGLFWGVVGVITCAVIVAVVAFFWFVTNHAAPKLVEKSAMGVGPAVFTAEEVERMLETNLRAFLKADSNDERLKYVYRAEQEKPHLDIYYGKRGHVENHLWKIERVEPFTSAQGDIWFVVFRDVARKQRVVSFQRDGDDFLIHWSAMAVFCEMPWEEFILSRPVGPVMMRGYLRQHGASWPVGISREEYHCFLLEDQEGVFSETVVMKRDAPGCLKLMGLSGGGKHPVTVDLGYESLPAGDATRRRLQIMALRHLRWQKMSMDSALDEFSR